MKTITPRNVFLFLVIAGQVFLQGYRWSKCDAMTSDFPYFFAVANLYESGKNPYDLNAQCQAQASLRGGECAGYAHAPFLLPLMSAVFNNDFYQSYRRWGVFQIILLGVCVWLLYLLTGNLFASLQCAVFPPIIDTMLIGNDTLVILTSVIGFVALLLSGRDLWAGAVLAVATLKPHLALPLAIPLLFVRPKACLGFCIGGAFLVSFSFLIVGFDGLYGMVQVMRSLSHGGTFGGITQEYMFNFTGLFARFGVSTFWAWPIYLASITFVSIYLRRLGITKRSLSLAIVLAVFTSPYTWFYDLAYLVVPLVFVHPLGPAIATLITALLMLGLPWWSIYLMIIGLIAATIHADSKDVNDRRSLNYLVGTHETSAQRDS